MKRKLLAGITLNFMIPSIIIGLCWWWDIPLFIPIGFISVLLIHEAGHLLSMKYFGYADLGFYLLLPLGAVAYGQKEYSRTSEAIIIYMAGPLPGIFIGAVLAPIAEMLESDIIMYFAIIFLFINTINLLPIYPLDGGRLLVSLLRLNRKQLLFAIMISMVITLLAIFLFWLFDLLILVAIQVYLFFAWRSEKEFVSDYFYDLNAKQIVLFTITYLTFTSLVIWGIIYYLI